MFIGLDLGQEVYAFDTCGFNNLKKMYVGKIETYLHNNNPVTLIGLSRNKECDKITEHVKLQHVYPTKAVAKEELRKYLKDKIDKTLED